MPAATCVVCDQQGAPHRLFSAPEVTPCPERLAPRLRQRLESVLAVTLVYEEGTPDRLCQGCENGLCDIEHRVANLRHLYAATASRYRRTKTPRACAHDSRSVEDARLYERGSETGPETAPAESETGDGPIFPPSAWSSWSAADAASWHRETSQSRLASLGEKSSATHKPTTSGDGVMAGPQNGTESDASYTPLGERRLSQPNTGDTDHVINYGQAQVIHSVGQVPLLSPQQPTVPGRSSQSPYGHYHAPSGLLQEKGGCRPVGGATICSGGMMANSCTHSGRVPGVFSEDNNLCGVNGQAPQGTLTCSSYRDQNNTMEDSKSLIVKHEDESVLDLSQTPKSEHSSTCTSGSVLDLTIRRTPTPQQVAFEKYYQNHQGEVIQIQPSVQPSSMDANHNPGDCHRIQTLADDNYQRSSKVSLQSGEDSAVITKRPPPPLIHMSVLKQEPNEKVYCTKDTDISGGNHNREIPVLMNPGVDRDGYPGYGYPVEGLHLPQNMHGFSEEPPLKKKKKNREHSPTSRYPVLNTHVSATLNVTDPPKEQFLPAEKGTDYNHNVAPNGEGSFQGTVQTTTIQGTMRIPLSQIRNMHKNPANISLLTEATVHSSPALGVGVGGTRHVQECSTVIPVNLSVHPERLTLNIPLGKAQEDAPDHLPGPAPVHLPDHLPGPAPVHRPPPKRRAQQQARPEGGLTGCADQDPQGGRVLAASQATSYKWHSPQSPTKLRLNPQSPLLGTCVLPYLQKQKLMKLTSAPQIQQDLPEPRQSRPHQGQSYQGQPPQGQLQQGQPHQGQSQQGQPPQGQTQGQPQQDQPQQCQPQLGRPQLGQPQQGQPHQGQPQQGQHHQGQHQQGQPQQGQPHQGQPHQGQPQQGQPQQGQPQQGQPQQGQPQQGQPHQGQPHQGQPHQGQPQQGQPQQGQPQQGQPQQGQPQQGQHQQGQHQQGQHQQGQPLQGQPHQGQPQQGQPQQGQPQQGQQQQSPTQQGQPQPGQPQQDRPQQGQPQQGQPQQSPTQQGQPQQGQPQLYQPPQGQPQQGQSQQHQPQYGQSQQGLAHQVQPLQGHQGQPQQGQPQQGHHQGQPQQGHPHQGPSSQHQMHPAQSPQGHYPQGQTQQIPQTLNQHGQTCEGSNLQLDRPEDREDERDSEEEMEEEEEEEGSVPESDPSHGTAFPRHKDSSGRRQLLRPWLEERLDQGHIPGFQWLDKEKNLFKIPWKHRSKNDWRPDNCTIFMEWAVHTGKYRAGRDPPDYCRWKTRLRCAFNQAVDIRERKDLKKMKCEEPYKVYEFLPKAEVKPKVQTKPKTDVSTLPAGASPSSMSRPVTLLTHPPLGTSFSFPATPSIQTQTTVAALIQRTSSSILNHVLQSPAALHLSARSGGELQTPHGALTETKSWDTDDENPLVIDLDREETAEVDRHRLPRRPVSTNNFTYLRGILAKNRGPGSADRAFVSGDRAVTSGDRAVMSGERVLTSDQAVMSGDQAVTSGDRAVISGERVLTSDQAVMSGDRAVMSGDQAVTSGDRAFMSGDRAFLCTSCGQSFAHHEALVNHYQVEHGDTQTTEQQGSTSNTQSDITEVSRAPDTSSTSVEVPGESQGCRSSPKSGHTTETDSQPGKDSQGEHSSTEHNTLLAGDQNSIDEKPSQVVSQDCTNIITENSEKSCSPQNTLSKTWNISPVDSTHLILRMQKQ